MLKIKVNNYHLNRGSLSHRIKFMQGNFTKHHTQKGACKPKPCSACLKCAISTSILQKAKKLYHLNQQLKKVLPKTIHQHCYLMDWNVEEITFGVDAAEWLIHVREHERDITFYIATQIKVAPTTKVKYLVRPQQNNVQINKSQPSRGASKISLKNRDLLQTIANTITDKELKAAMLKLASA